MTEYADHALDVAYVNYGEYESFIKSEPDAVCVIAIATGDVNSYYDGIRNMDSYNGNTAARTQVVYTVPKSFKNTIKALQELGILNSKLYRTRIICRVIQHLIRNTQANITTMITPPHPICMTIQTILILMTANIDTGTTLQESRILNGTLQRTTNRLNRQRRP